MFLQARFNIRSLMLIILLLNSFMLSACSVAPWERGNLAKRHMSIVPDPNKTALRRHVFDSKESSQGGMGVAGGGCGCN